MLQWFKNWSPMILISVAGFWLDWYTKILAVKHLTYGHVEKLIGDFAGFVLVYNKAAVFGLDPKRLIPGLPVNSMFMIFTFIAMIILIIYFSRLPKNLKWTRLGLILVMPGALGNLWDRVFFPLRGVVDFMRIGISESVSWPIFNVADIFVTAGIIALLIGFFRENTEKPSTTVSDKASAKISESQQSNA